MSYVPKIDVDNLFAIDVHVHAGRSASAPRLEGASTRPTRDDTLARSTARGGVGGQTPAETAAYYRERKIAACIWGGDPASTRGWREDGVTNDEMIEAATEHSDILIPFVMVDPWRGTAGAQDAERLIQAGARGFKFHPPGQGFYPNERRVYEIYEVINHYRSIACFTQVRQPSARAPRVVGASD